MSEEEKPKVKVRHINKKRVVGVLLAGAILIGGTIGTCNLIKKRKYTKIPKIDKSISDVVYIQHEETVFDSLYMKTPMYLVDELEVSASEYEILDKLDLDKYYTEDLIEQEVTIDKQEIDELINKYYELKDKVDFKTPSIETNEFYYVVGKLVSCKNQFTKDIYIDGVGLINDISAKYIKSLVVDSLGEPVDCIDNIEVLPFYTENRELLIKYTDFTSGKVYYLNPSKYSLLSELIDNLISLNEMNNKYLKGELKNINHLASKEDITLQNLKACILCSYTIEDGIIKQNEPCKDLVKKLN